jgi:hypothetical protein
LVHEIEWARATGSARWTIEAEDVEFSWQPDSATHSPPVP